MKRLFWILMLGLLVLSNGLVVAQKSGHRVPTSVNIQENIPVTKIHSVTPAAPVSPRQVQAVREVPGTYSTIQAAIAAADVGDMINIAAGTYSENITISKSVTIQGAGESSTIIHPAVSDPGSCPGAGSFTNSQVMVVSAHNVVITGLTIDGDNPSLTSGVVVNGADLDARNGIIESNGPWNNLEVHHVTVKNVYLRAIYPRSGGSGFNIHHCTVQNVAACYGSIGIFNFGGSGTFANNMVSDANDAISANWSRGTKFVNNVITNCASGIHTDNNGGSGGVADTIDGNQVSNSPAGGYGIWIFFPYVNAVAKNNTVTNVEIGLFAWGGSGGAGQFINNIVDGQNKPNSIGAYVTVGPDYWASYQANVSSNFSGNSISNNVYGFVVETDETAPFFSLNLSVAGHTATGNTVDIYTAGIGSMTITGLSGNTLSVSAPGKIQTAINLANSGGMITVGAGTYKEQLIIAKGLTILGDTLNPENVIIDGENATTLASPGQIRIYNPSGAVTFRGFKIINYGRTSSSDYFAVLTKGNYTKTIQNCRIFGHYATVDIGTDYGIWAYTATGELLIKENFLGDMYHAVLLEQQYGAATIENNTFDHLYTGLYSGSVYGGRAIEAINYGTTDITSLQKVKGNTFTNFKSTGIQFSGGFSGQIPRKFTNVVIENNNLTFATTDIVNLNGAIYCVNASSGNSDPNGGVTADIHNNIINVPGGSGIQIKGLNGNITCHNNSIAGTPYALKANEALTTVVNAGSNWFSSNVEATVAAAVVGNVDFTPYLHSGTDTDLLTPGFQGDFSVLDVTASGSQIGSTGRIEEAVGLVSGSTVNVAAGTFVEGSPQVVINKNVSVVGQDKATTIITPGGNTGTSGDSRGWFFVAAGNEFNLSNVTLDGSGKNIYMAVLSRGTGTIDNNIVRNIRYQKYLGMGLMMYGGNFIISNNTLTNIERIGMYCNGPGVTNGQFIGNTYTGKGDGDWLDYGIEIERGAAATATGNSVSNCTGVAATDGSTSAGMYLTTYFAPGTTGTFLNNTLTHNYVGLEVGYDGTDGSVAVAHGNSFIGNTGYGIYSTGPFVDATNNYWGSMFGPSDVVGTTEVPATPKPLVANMKNTVPAGALGDSVGENVDYYPWLGGGLAGPGVTITAYGSPVSNTVSAGLDAGALDGVDPLDVVAPPPPPSNYIYLYFLLAPGSPLPNYSTDIKKDEASLATNAKAWDLKALTDLSSHLITFELPPTAELPVGFKPTLYHLTTGNYVNLRAMPLYSYTSGVGGGLSDFRLLIGDSTAPAVTLTAPNGGEFLVVGTPYTITWTSSDGTGILRHYVYYSSTGAAPYTLIDSTNGTVHSLAWTPLAATTTGSIKVVARDSVMNEQFDISDHTFTVLASNSISMNAVAGWNLVSVPMLQGDMSPAGVFGDDYGIVPYYTFQYSPTGGYSIPAALSMGQGYWLGSNSAQTIDAVGTPITSLNYNLANGFNIIGNPFAGSLLRSDLQFTDGVSVKNFPDAALAGWVSNVLYGYTDPGGYYYENTALGVWTGYWVPALVPGISIQYAPSVIVPTPKIAPEPISVSHWSIPVVAEVTNNGVSSSRDQIAVLGVEKAATVGYDLLYDAPRPPRVPGKDFIEVGFTSMKSDQRYTSAFGSQLVARDIRPLDKTQWEFLVTTSQGGGMVTLAWDKQVLSQLPVSLEMKLFDPANHAVIDMRAMSSYTYEQEGTSHEFFVNRNPGSSLLQGEKPAAFALGQNYPNPFNPSTRITYDMPTSARVTLTVYDVLGRAVAEILKDQSVEAGRYTVSLDASKLAAGIYMYRLDAVGLDGSHFSSTQKMSLVK